MAESQRQTAAATLSISSRFEQIRASNWSVITSATAVQNSILNQASPAAGSLPVLEEQITISDYPPATPPSTPICVRRHADGSTEIVSNAVGGTLLDRLVVRVDVQARWSGGGGRARIRESSTLVALGGIGK
jgi:hypothetical protein